MKQNSSCLDRHLSSPPSRTLRFSLMVLMFPLPSFLQYPPSRSNKPRPVRLVAHLAHHQNIAGLLLSLSRTRDSPSFCHFQSSWLVSRPSTRTPRASCSGTHPVQPLPHLQVSPQYLCSHTSALLNPICSCPPLAKDWTCLHRRCSNTAQLTPGA